MTTDVNNSINSSPYEVKNQNNTMLGVFLKDTGFTPNSTCLEVVLGKKGEEFNNNLSKYLKKVGTYNYKGSFNPKWIPGYWQDYKDLIEKCPQEWDDMGDSRCVNTKKDSNNNYVYRGGCDAGQDYYKWELRYIRTDWEPYNVPIYDWIWYTRNQENCYGAWFWRYCVNRRVWDRYWGLKRWETRYREKPIWEWKYIKYTQPPSNLENYTANQKREFETRCGVLWPTKKRWIEGYWVCDYGPSLDEDIGSNNVIKLGEAKDYIEATKLALTNQQVNQPQFFAFGKGQVFLQKNGGQNLFQSKGEPQPNCSQNMGQIDVYEINREIYQKLNECKDLNDKMNTVVVTSSTPIERESFENYGKVGKDWRYLVLLIMIIIFLIIVLR